MGQARAGGGGKRLGQARAGAREKDWVNLGLGLASSVALIIDSIHGLATKSLALRLSRG